jgi:CheY-like chemotaxis protein
LAGELPTVSGVKLHRPHTILVVDDDAAVRNLSLTLLRRCGFRTLEAFDGESGLSTFLRHQNDVDLVLTDVVMPKVSGPQMVDKILESNPSVKVVFMSGTQNNTLPQCHRRELPVIIGEIALTYVQ